MAVPLDDQLPELLLDLPGLRRRRLRRVLEDHPHDFAPEAVELRQRRALPLHHALVFLLLLILLFVLLVRVALIPSRRFILTIEINLTLSLFSIIGDILE